MKCNLSPDQPKKNPDFRRSRVGSSKGEQMTLTKPPHLVAIVIIFMRFGTAKLYFETVLDFYI